MSLNLHEQETGSVAAQSADLDKYGVWVKKPPRTIEDISTTDDTLEPSPIDDFESLARDETSALDDFIQNDETQMVDNTEETSSQVQEENIPIDTFIDADFLDDFTNDISVLLENESKNDEVEEETVLEYGNTSDEEGQFLAPEPVQSVEEEVDLDEFLGDADVGILDDVDNSPTQEEPNVEEVLSTENVNIVMDEEVESEDGILVQDIPDTEETIITDEEAQFLQSEPVQLVEEEVDLDEFLGDADVGILDDVDNSPIQEEPSVEEVLPTENVDIVMDEEVEAEDGILVQDIPDTEETIITDEETQFLQSEPVQLVEEEIDLDEFLGDADIEILDDVDNTSIQEETTIEEVLPIEEEKISENQEVSIDRMQISDYTDENHISEDDFDVDELIAGVENLENNVAFSSPDEKTEESQDYKTEKPEETMGLEMEQPAVSRTEELISNIASEIALLRTEVANLKSEFEAFKSGKTGESVQVIETEPQQESSSGGFFADSGDDDTIALSGDELSNIFNTADFTEESVEADSQQMDEDSENGLPAMDFDSEELEEPIIEENYFENQEEGLLPDEIDVPTGSGEDEKIFEEIEIDDEDTVFEEVMDEVSEITEESVQIEEFSGEDEIISEVEDLENISIAETSDTTTLSELETFEDSQTEEFAELETLDESQTEVLSELETFEDSKTEVLSELETLEAVTEEANFEEEISDEPIETVFESDQWEEVPEGDLPPTEPVEEAEQESLEQEDSSAIIEDLTDDPLIIEEPVDTVSLEEESLLEELEEIPVIEDFDTIEVPQVPQQELDITANLSGEESTVESLQEPVSEQTSEAGAIPEELKGDIKAVLAYMDQLLDSLPEDKIAEFARSEHFERYKKLFTELGLS